jgi:multidrug efflux pump subunit AcrA (membrane-fusion protein)
MITRLIDGLHYVHPSDYEIKRQEVLDQSERIAELEVALDHATGQASVAAKDAEIVEMEALFDLQQTRMEEATVAWRAAHPGNDTTLPDLGELLKWLLARIAELEAALDRAEHHMKYAISEIVSPEWLIDDIKGAIEDVRRLRGEGE